MSVFEIDYSKAQEFAKITDGTYEVIVDKAVQNASQGGTDFLDIQLKIREDFNQPLKTIVSSIKSGLIKKPKISSWTSNEPR